jgi:dienelactone hydrolase
MIPLLLACMLSLPAIERGTVEFRPTAAEEQVPPPFRLPASEFSYELTPILATPDYSVSGLRFDSPIKSADPSNNVVPAEYFRPLRPGRMPAAVVLHILGADFALSRFMAARLADHGVAALFMRLPYYGERRPAGDAGRSREFLSQNIERTVLAMRQGACDVRRAACWLAGRPEVDPSRIGVSGISLGGIISSVVVAIDPAISRGAFIMAGGDVARIIWQMPEAAPFRKKWEGSGRTLADLRGLTGPFDPLTYADRLNTKRVLMFGAKVDEVVPPDCTIALWERAGKPPIHWYDCGHYSAIGYLMPAIRKTAEFLAMPNPDAVGEVPAAAVVTP